jgi:hypothetical protein
MTDEQFEKWIKGFQEDFTLRQKEVIARLTVARCSESFKKQKVLKIKVRRRDLG